MPLLAAHAEAARWAHYYISRPSEVVRRDSGTSIPTRRANSRLAASAFTTGYVSVDVDSFAMNCASPSIDL